MKIRTQMGSRQQQGPYNRQGFVDYGFQPIPPNVQGQYARGANQQQAYDKQQPNLQMQGYAQGNTYQKGDGVQSNEFFRDRSRNSPFTYSQTYAEPVTWKSIHLAFSTKIHPDEPSIFEEMEINPTHILSKGLAVLRFGVKIDSGIMDDTDLAGPVFFCLLFGVFLLASGKGQFGYIYMFTTLGWAIIYVIFNLMSAVPIRMSLVASVIGYCFLPIVLLCPISVLIGIRQNLIGLILTFASSLWCTYSASSIFSTILQMHAQKALLAYPMFLFYSTFALLALF